MRDIPIKYDNNAVDFSVNHYFVLIVPLCGVLQGAVLIGCWAAMRQHQYLLWVAASYILSSIPLAAQSMMTTSQFATWSVVTSTLYMTGIWSAAKGMAEKSGVSAHPRLAVLIAVVTLLLLFYFSIMSNQLWNRMVILNTALFLLTALPLIGVLRKERSPVFIEQLLRIAFVMLVSYAFVRTFIIFISPKPEVTEAFSQSVYWLLLLASSMIISLLFTFVLLACAVKDTLIALQHERNRDPLTHLLNRRAFFELAEITMQSAGKKQWAVMICDIDHFKRVNDTWGHAAGDQVLKMVGESLLLQSRQGDLVARFGGEEFVVLMKCGDLLVANSIAQRMRIAVSQITFPDVPVTVTASFGIAMVAEYNTLEEAIAHADGFLYQAKNAGRNQVFFKLSDTSQGGLEAV